MDSLISQNGLIWYNFDNANIKFSQIYSSKVYIKTVFFSEYMYRGKLNSNVLFSDPASEIWTSSLDLYLSKHIMSLTNINRYLLSYLITTANYNHFKQTNLTIIQSKQLFQLEKVVFLTVLRIKYSWRPFISYLYFIQNNLYTYFQPRAHSCAHKTNLKILCY